MPGPRRGTGESALDVVVRLYAQLADGAEKACVSVRAGCYPAVGDAEEGEIDHILGKVYHPGPRDESAGEAALLFLSAIEQAKLGARRTRLQARESIFRPLPRAAVPCVVEHVIVEIPAVTAVVAYESFHAPEKHGQPLAGATRESF